MQKSIEIDGIIGWDFGAKDIRDALKGLNGENLEININSPGGLVTEGIAIFNYLKNYAGKKVAKISGIAASMASYIALAADVVIVEENSIFMIHNASIEASGDFNDLRKAADISYRMSKILSDEYSRKTGMSQSSLKKLMDEETFFYGREIVEAGFADVLVPSSTPLAKEDVLARAEAAILTSDSLIKKLTINGDTEKIVAFFNDFGLEDTLQKVEKDIKCPDIMENYMNFDQIKEKFPEEVDKISSFAVEEERKRVSGLLLWKGISAEGDAILLEAIASGKKSEEVAQQLYILSQKKSKLDEDNAEIVTTAKTESVSGASVLDEEDLKACEVFGIKVEDYKKVKGV